MAQVVEHILGKDEVTSSNLVSSSKPSAEYCGRLSFNAELKTLLLSRPPRCIIIIVYFKRCDGITRVRRPQREGGWCEPLSEDAAADLSIAVKAAAYPLR